MNQNKITEHLDRHYELRAGFNSIPFQPFGELNTLLKQEVHPLFLNQSFFGTLEGLDHDFGLFDLPIR